jgi:transforming growth factor-beta-induced protein
MFAIPNKTVRMLLSSLAVISITAGLTSGCSKESPKSAGTELKIVPGVLPAVTKQIPLASDFSQMLAASSVSVSAASSVKYTFFVPTNKAIEDYLAAKGMTKAAVLADVTQLNAFVSAHVTTGEITATSLLNRTGESLTMVGGGSLVIGKSKDGQVTLTPAGTTEATLIAIDVPATNGLVHLVNKVLAP